METLSVLLALCAGNSLVTGEFPAQRPVTRSFDVFFDMRLIKRLSKQSWGWWFEMSSRSLWRQYDYQTCSHPYHSFNNFGASIASKLTYSFAMLLVKGITNSARNYLMIGGYEYQHLTVTSLYYKLSICRGYIWYDNAPNTIITMIKLRSDLHSRTTPILRPYGRAMGCFSPVIRRKWPRYI